MYIVITAQQQPSTKITRDLVEAVVLRRDDTLHNKPNGEKNRIPKVSLFLPFPILSGQF